MRFIFILFAYGAVWQVSDRLSVSQDVTLLLKIFFQTSASILLINLIMRLEYTRFTALFVGLQLLNILSLFIIIFMDKFASVSAFNYSVEVFSIFNIQLIYTDLIALAGITFDMGSHRGKFEKSFNADLYRSASLVSVRNSQKKIINLA